MSETKETFLIVGAGPSGLAMARNFQRESIPFRVVEVNDDVGGLWDIKNPRSTVYHSAHLISSKKTTEFSEFPMKESAPDYPHHSDIKSYMKDFAQSFGLTKHIVFNTQVDSIRPEKDRWRIRTTELSTKKQTEELYKGVVLANGTLNEPNRPKLPFEEVFQGTVMHSANYKTPDIFRGKRVLVVGAGNSGCDIAVDAVHHAASIDMSVRRGYHFVPKYILGQPADTIGGKIKLPSKLKQKVDSVILKFFTGNPQRFGFPRPDHKLYESHPIINSLVLHYIGHGDLQVKPGIERLIENGVRFKDGTEKEYDLILLATGYKLHYPFIDPKELNWKGSRPHLYLNVFHPTYPNLFMMGMIEAAGIGWQGRYEQAQLIAKSTRAWLDQKPSYREFEQRKKQELEMDLSGGLNYLKLDRMSYYVHKDTYRSKVHELTEAL